jgi:hypothetical protein
MLIATRPINSPILRMVLPLGVGVDTAAQHFGSGRWLTGPRRPAIALNAFVASATRRSGRWRVDGESMEGDHGS